MSRGSVRPDSTSPVELVGIALGSNLGNRAVQMQRGLDFLRGLSVTGHFLCSSIFATEPVDCPPGSDPFLNAIAEIAWGGTPQDLWIRLQDFEQSLGRARVHPVNSPRPLDLDIIYFGQCQLQDSHLIVPHPRATQRDFVLRPLSEIRPELILPGETKTVRQLLALLGP